MRQLSTTFLHNPDQELTVVRTFDDPETDVRYFIVQGINEDGTMSAGLALSEANVRHLYQLLGEVL